ncbi:MAG: tyrosine-type recombinase/integrase [Gemmataceae bacterium]|nr:tyrosine-type recombinase/integrase [Gemmataceae bacterium]
MQNSTSAPRRRNHQAAKPYPDFPLTAHPSGRWCKKIAGKLHYFGPIAIDGVPAWREALKEWERQRVDLLAGREPAPQTAEHPACTIREICNRFLTAKKGEITPRSWKEYDTTVVRILEDMGREISLASLTSDDFDRLKAGFPATWGKIRRWNEIQRVRTILVNYSWEIRKTIRLAEQVDPGPNFKKGTGKDMKAEINRGRAKHGLRKFEAKDIRTILDAADTTLRAMILLGINAAFGQEDIGRLPIDAIDLQGGWVTFPRPKNSNDRRAKLWPETVEAIRGVLTERKEPANPDVKPLLFVTVRGHAWTNPIYGATAVTHELDKLLERLSMKRTGVSFYALRRTFRTVADETNDRRACDLIMGHVDGSIAERHYIEGFDDGRLVKVAEYVRNWLFAKPEGGSNHG